MFHTGIGLRPMQLGDSPHLLNIDLKSSEFPWEVADWELLNNYFKHWRVLIALFNNTPAAFSVFELDSDEDSLHIHKLEALPIGKRVGLQFLMLDAIEHDGRCAALGVMDFIVPVSSCRGPGDPYDISEWVSRAGFKCQREEPSMFEGYGKEIAGYVFQKTIEYGK